MVMRSEMGFVVDKALRVRGVAGFGNVEECAIGQKDRKKNAIRLYCSDTIKKSSKVEKNNLLIDFSYNVYI